jgi:hypothetical protein
MAADCRSLDIPDGAGGGNGGWLWYQVGMGLDRPAVGTVPTADKKRLIPISCLPNTDLSSTFYR